jgi:serine/threonine protein kinase
MGSVGYLPPMQVGTGDSLLVGRYRIIRSLGSGGMATVSLCQDERLGRRVAVKRLHAHGGDDDQRRFLREARVGASLNHPNLVSVYDTAMDGESVLIVMEYVEGETLAEAIGRGPLTTERVLSTIRDVAAALDHAHAHDIVHRDVKPANILLRVDGAAKLVDLGIALAADTTRITHDGTVLGTAAYMAPEQLDGRPAGPAADVYGLAAVAFEALSGRKARRGRTPLEVAHRVATEPPPDLTEAWPDAPDAAAKALREGMARDPAERPSSPGELAKRLEGAFARDATPSAREPSPASPPIPPRPAAPPKPVSPGRPPRGRPRIPAVLALALVALAVAGVVLLGAGGGGGSDDRRAEPSRDAQRGQQRERAEREQPSGGQSSERPQAPSDGLAQQQQPAAGGAAEGARLNAQGFALMRQERFEEAIPVLERAVEAFPEGTSDIRYAYALYNLGSSLRRAGRPREAIPYLERRLQIPNQAATVRRELETARREAR